MITAKLLLVFVISGLVHTLPPINNSPSPVTDDPHSHLFEVGSAANLVPASRTPAELKVVSYNIRYRAGKDLQKLATLFKNDPEIGSAAILGLQEVDRNRKRTGNKNTIKALADELGMHYAWAAPPSTKSEKEEETGVAILSPYPLSEVKRIVLPHEGPGKRRRVGLGATVHAGVSKLRVYSVHAENRMSLQKKLDQTKAILADLAHYESTMPAVVLGDLNTWEGDVSDELIKLFKGQGFHTPFGGESTFCRQIVFVPITFRLDWIWLRNLQPVTNGIDKEISLSDHWPLWVTLNLKPKGADSITKKQSTGER